MPSTFDNILEKQVGEFGKFQIMVVTLLSISNIFISLTGMSAIFIGDKPVRHCKIPMELLKLNCSYEQIEAYVVPNVHKNGQTIKDECHIFNRNFTRVTENQVCPNTKGNDISELHIDDNTVCQGIELSDSVSYSYVPNCLIMS